jgi:hypothetical protein
MAIKRFTLILGIFLVAAGILGFFPGVVTFPAHDLDHNVGHLFGLFPINALHNLVHIGLGVWALAASKSVDNSRKFNRANAIIYGVLAVFGIIPGLNTLFGLVPLYSHDIWLHAGIAIVSAYFGYSWLESGAVASDRSQEDRRTG